MNYYEVSVRFERREGSFTFYDEMIPFPDSKEDNEKLFYKNLCKEINESFGLNTDRKTNIYAYQASEGIVKFIYEADLDEVRQGKTKKEIREAFRDKYDQVDITVSKPKEITCETFYKLGRYAYKKDYIDSFDDDEIDVFRSDSHPFSVKEELIPEKDYSLEMMRNECNGCLMDDSFSLEIERIFSTDNEKKYYGNPVHYLLTVTDRDSAEDMIVLLTKALRSNKRLLGRRITKFSNIKEGCYDEDEFEYTVARSEGNVVVVELDGSQEEHGNYASSYHLVAEYISEMFKKYQRNTLFVFVKNSEHPGFANTLLNMITENARIIELKEGGGDTDHILKYIQKLADKDGQPVDENELRKTIGNKKFIKVGEAHRIYNKCFSNALMYKIYKAYKTGSYVKTDMTNINGRPYEELQNMIGLNEVKKVVESVVNNAKIQKIRSEKGMDSFRTSLHMVFNGNPGSAKTTVARLLAQILAQEGVIDNTDIVECGRGDLVGKYVGWTAKTVSAKFKEARGGVLFIDEAYSLVEHWEGSYGDEAINTIVQEMENHRDDVIVIFAGYPDKMKDFLERNEGLRSRITFHLDFPDYNAEELIQILQLMTDQKGLKLAPGVLEKCEKIFKDAVKQKDYGNGRFVRNLLEQAMLAQSNRLAMRYKNRKISRKALISLKPEDFDVNASRQCADRKIKIGFSTE